MKANELIHGDCLDVLPTLGAESFGSVVTDPPYHLKSSEGDEAGFMGCEWDGGGVAFRPETWKNVLRVTKPGGYLLAFGGTRTWHRLACAVEDAGWEIRDTIMWLYGQGMPKGKATLKPAWNPILMARKPGPRVLPLNIEGSRVSWQGRQPTQEEWNGKGSTGGKGHVRMGQAASEVTKDAYAKGLIPVPAGRWPANVCLSCDCDGEGHAPDCPVALLDAQSGPLHTPGTDQRPGSIDGGGASRFFYCPKASKADRGKGNTHPTVKPQALMRWLVGLVTFPGNLVLDPFMGSGTTGVVCVQTGRCFLGIELSSEHYAIARRRVCDVNGPLFAPDVMESMGPGETHSP